MAFERKHSLGPESPVAKSSFEKNSIEKTATFNDCIALKEPTPERQAQQKSYGVKQAEILALYFLNSTWKIVVCFSCALLAALGNSLASTTTRVVANLATDSYKTHSLLSTVKVINAVAGAAANPVLARLSDVFGRLEILIVSILFYVVGTVIQSQAWNVERFAAGGVFSTVGSCGILLTIEVSMADFSTLKWRMLISHAPVAQFIINLWVSGYITLGLTKHHSWNYAYGIWAFIVPLCVLPLFLCLLYLRICAWKTDQWKQLKEEERANWQGKNVFVELFWLLDLVGVLLMICVLGFILVPFTIAGGTSKKWQRASTIAPLVIGFLLIPVFCIWEKRYAKRPVVPFPLLKERGVWSSLLISGLAHGIFYLPGSYMYTVLVVGMGESVELATRISRLYPFASAICGIFVGVVVAYTRRTKPFIIFGCAVWFIGMGLFVHFRGDNDGVRRTYFVNGIIAGMAVLGIGGGFFIRPNLLSLQLCTNHEYMAVLIALFLAMRSIFVAISSSIGGAIWTQVMYDKIHENMRKVSTDPVKVSKFAFGSPMKFARKYKWGTPERIAVAMAYARVQKYICIVALCLVVPLVCCSFFLRDHRLENVQDLNEDIDSADGVVVNKSDKDSILVFLKRYFKYGVKRK